MDDHGLAAQVDAVLRHALELAVNAEGDRHRPTALVVETVRRALQEQSRALATLVAEAARIGFPSGFVDEVTSADRAITICLEAVLDVLEGARRYPVPLMFTRQLSQWVALCIGYGDLKRVRQLADHINSITNKPMRLDPISELN